MIEHFGKYKMDVADFCTYHFIGNSDKIWSDEDTKTSEFIEQKYECLAIAGIPKGFDYCTDISRAGGASQSWMQFEDCNVEHQVSLILYGEPRCESGYSKYQELDEAGNNDYLNCMSENVDSDESFKNIYLKNKCQVENLSESDEDFKTDEDAFKKLKACYDKEEKEEHQV